ncbi:hypothetical protein [Arthrobacter sp. UM1]|uniref:hypothetical protein n=1 Tax=Arthrobacter sp. UM1 TaxID=2766776 RepID=UPI001CF65624|nr:hypothetical protein [Arthrobacter sp. UM1]MCB4208503.1 hypothetical protein [Arthrobacter sp. UM1]
MNSLSRPHPSRRRVAQAAWAAPAVLAAAAAPAASASTPTPKPPLPPEYLMDVSGTSTLRGRFDEALRNFQTYGTMYANYSVNDVYEVEDFHQHWAVERKEGVWQNLVPGKTYRFSVSASSAPYFDCRSGTASKTLLVFSSPDGMSWAQSANFRSQEGGSRPPGASRPETTLALPLATTYCTQDFSKRHWGPSKTVTFSQTAGPDGKVRFRFDAWLRTRIRKDVSTVPGSYPTSATTGNAFMRWSRPEIVA